MPHRERRGIYEAAAGLHLGLVVVPELPPSRETLMLRLMGSGRTLRQALAELGQLKANTLERRLAVPILIAVQLDASCGIFSKDREALIDAMKVYQEWEAGVEARGEARGEARAGRRAGRRGRSSVC